MKKNVNKKHRKSGMMVHTLTMAILIWVILMIVVFGQLGVSSSYFYELRNDMATDVYYADGSTAHFADGDFGTVKKDARILVHIRLKKELPLYAAELFVPLYNAHVDVYLGGKVLYREATEDIDHTKYGNRIYEIPLPDDFENEELLLDIVSLRGMPFSDLNRVGIIPANEGWKRLLSGNGLIFAMSLFLMILSLVSVIYFGVRSLTLGKLQIGLPVAFFELMINAWFFGSMKLFYLLFGNQEFCAKAEYYTLYLAPLPLAYFIYTQMDVKAVKRLVGGVCCFYLLFYLATTAIELAPVSLTYSDMITWMHMCAAVVILILITALFAGTKRTENPHVYILRYGVLFCMLCGIFELMRFNVTKYLLEGSWVSTHGVSALAIFALAMALVIYLVSVSTEEYTARIEQEQLMILAYKDALTDIPNRADFYRRMETMEKEDVREFTMVFYDLNNLKLANDKYGHETGDRLLKMTAEHLKEIYSDGGFCARWGGDEFVACVIGDEADALERIGRFRKRLEEEDASGSFPFAVSAACGYVRSRADGYINPVEAIRQADVLMYENKKQMKSAKSKADNS